MSARTTLTRLLVAASLIGSLGACAIAPAPPGYYRSGPPVVVETYPTYRYYGQPYGYYEYERRPYYGGHSHDRGYYRDDHRRQESVRIPSPLEVHRDVRRSLGLPRLPGMP